MPDVDYVTTPADMAGKILQHAATAVAAKGAEIKTPAQSQTFPLTGLCCDLETRDTYYNAAFFVDLRQLAAPYKLGIGIEWRTGTTKDLPEAKLEVPEGQKIYFPLLSLSKAPPLLL